MDQRFKLAFKTHILKFSTTEVTAMNKAMELIDQKFFKNSYHLTFKLKWVTVRTQDLNIFSVTVNPTASLQYIKD